MTTISQCACGVIPRPMLTRLAEQADPKTRKDARSTLEEMQRLADNRARTFANVADAVPTALTKRLSVYDARRTTTLPGRIVTAEPMTHSRDVEVREAYDGCIAALDFYGQIMARDSIDGHGLRVVSSVHYGKRFDNAMWNGHQMVYGDGDGRFFNRFTVSPDVIGHELTHGVTQYSANLGYHGENGALNEHISDAFGMMIKQFMLGLSASESDWLIGAGLFTSNVHGIALRSMAAPGTAYDDPILGRDPQPSHMRNYVETSEDNGGVHINSGIPNHAFYRAATEIGGRTCDVVGRVWYLTLTERLQSNAGFRDFAQATVNVALEPDVFKLEEIGRDRDAPQPVDCRDQRSTHQGAAALAGMPCRAARNATQRFSTKGEPNYEYHSRTRRSVRRRQKPCCDQPLHQGARQSRE